MALEGIKVLDLSRLAPGPYCSMLLADFGADVLLVEAPPGANAKLSPNQHPEEAVRAAAYYGLGRGKRSIALNLKDEGAREVFIDLVKTVDVVIEGFRPGVVKRLRIDYDSVAHVNPRLIYCSISGFGQTGPYRNFAGHDLNYISVAGVLGSAARPAEAAAIPLNLIADFAGGGLHAALSICLAIIARDRSGRGQSIDIAMSDGVLSLMTAAFSAYFRGGPELNHGESMLIGETPYYNIYETGDRRWISIASVEAHFYSELCQVLSATEFADKQFDQADYPAMFETFGAAFRTKTADEWMAIMSEHDICASPVLSMEGVASDPQVLAREMVLEVDSPIGKVKQIGVGAKLSDTPGRVRGTSPLLGQHTDEVLTTLGYDAPKIAALRQTGAVA